LPNSFSAADPIQGGHVQSQEKEQIIQDSSHQEIQEKEALLELRKQLNNPEAIFREKQFMVILLVSQILTNILHLNVFF